MQTENPEIQSLPVSEANKVEAAKFLILRFSSIGDIVLTSPVIRCLKQQVPNVEIHFAVKEAFLPVVIHNPYIDKVQVLAHSDELLIEELKLENYDYIIDLHHNLRTLRIKKQLGVKSFSFNKLNVQKWVYTNFKINMLPDVHIVDRYMETVNYFSVKNDGLGLDYFITAEEETKLNDIPASHHAGYIGFVIGANHFTKKWPVEKWKELCEKIQHPVILLGGKEDAANAEKIASADTVKIYNACGKFSLNESADLVRKAKLIVSHDTGLMHIAAAYKKPIISLWGNTVPKFGMYPYYGNVQRQGAILETKGLRCRPCSKIGYHKCPKGHFKCMNNIESDMVLNTIKSLI